MSDASNPFTGVKSTRVTDTHVYFWNGILSNHYTNSPRFSGTRCLDRLMPVLDGLQVPHPPENALSTRLVAAHDFNCGEQFMMVMKGWLFERNLELGEQSVDLQADESDDDVVGRKEFEALREELMCKKPQTQWPVDGKARNLYEGTVCSVLRADNPRRQKSLGRSTQGFDEHTWTQAGMAIVTASCAARAEVDPQLRRIYLAATDKSFVEGSPTDKIWGVGLAWDSEEIKDQKLWRGQNKLGKCHDEAANILRGASTLN